MNLINNWFKSSRGWQGAVGLNYTSRSGLSLLETESGSNLNATIIPSVGRFNSSNYATRSKTDFEVGDSSGYIEISWYHDGQANVKTLFATGTSLSTARFFRVYTSTNVLYFHVQSNISTVFNNRLFLTGGVSVGWHTIRFSSNGSSYSVLYDGSGGALTVSTGANDGRWLNFVPTRNTLEIGCYTDSSGLSTSATDFYIRYVDYNNKHKWLTHGQGNRIFDLIGTDHFTWTGTTHTHFDSNADTTLLTSGFSIWRALSVPDEYVPYVSGNPYDVSSTLTTYTKVSDHPGSVNGYNLAPALIGFNESSSASSLLEIFDRSNVTRQTNTSRASTYYNNTSLATRCRYHSSEICNPVVYHTFFNNGYRGRFYPRVITNENDTNVYPINISGIYVLNTDKKGGSQRSIMQTCNTNVFGAVGIFYDNDGYVLVSLSDIKHFGASQDNTSDNNFVAIQKAVKYTYNTNISFGDTGEEYEISQPVYLQSYKTYTINSTVKVKNATIVRLTQNYNAGEDHIHVVSTEGFNIGEWVGIRDNNCTYDYDLWWGWNTWIVNIDRLNNVIYFNTTEGASCIYNYTIAADAWVGHAQSVFIGENKTNITLTGTGLIDCNQANQAPINGLLPGSVFEELRSTSGVAFWISDNITISNLSFINGLRHNICISGTSTSAATRCDNIDVLNVTSTYAHNKNLNIRYCDDVLVEDYIGNDAIWEDGLICYLGNTNVIANRITCLRNGRWGICWNSNTGTGFTLNTFTTSGNIYGGLALTSAGGNIDNGIMGDRIVISNQYDNCNDHDLTNIAISNYTPATDGLYGESIIAILGAVTNIAMNEISINDCNGLGIYSTNQFTPAAPPVNVDFTGGGFYNHTGVKSSLFAGSDIVFSDFDNYP